MKNKLFAGVLFLVGVLSLTSCDFLDEGTSGDGITANASNFSDDYSKSSSSAKRKMKYEVGKANVDSWTNSIGTTWIKFSVPVTNTGNVDIYLENMAVDIESSTGTLLTTNSMVNAYPDYIKPGETAYYYDETMVDFDTNGIRVIPHVDVHKSSNEVIRYDISDVSITDDKYNGIKIIGRVENKTAKKGTLVYVSANLFDSNDKLICNCFTILENDLNAGDKVGFTCKPFAYTDFTPTDVARYEIYAYPTQFNIDFGF